MPGEAARKGLSTEAYRGCNRRDLAQGSARLAARWRAYSAFSGCGGARDLHTRAARPVDPCRFCDLSTHPPPELRKDGAALGERIGSTVAGLLSLLGIDADPLQSREHILLSTLLHEAWSSGRNLDLAALIQGIQKPAFDKVGVFDLETFYPAKERLQLAMRLNNLLAAPGFAAWMSGEPLDVQRLLYTPRRQTAYRDHFDRAFERCRTHVRRHVAAE